MNEEEIDLQSGQIMPAAQAGETTAAADEAKKAAKKKRRMNTDGMSAQEVLDAVLSMDDNQYTPWESTELPSKGVYYGWPAGFVNVRPMTISDEKSLANQRLAQTGESIDRVFGRCVQLPGALDPLDLLVGDRTWLLYYLRGITQGHDYEFTATCPGAGCSKQSIFTYDLRDLAATKKGPKIEMGMEPFRVSLPYLSEYTGRDFYVGLRFLRGRDINNMLASMKMTKRIGGNVARNRAVSQQMHLQQQQVQFDNLLSDQITTTIVHVMDQHDRVMIAQLVERMHARDTATIREWHKDNAPGIDTSVVVECPNCSLSFNVELPITDSFFRPKKAGGE